MGDPIQTRARQEQIALLKAALDVLQEELAPVEEAFAVEHRESLDRRLLEASKDYVNKVVGPNMNGDRC